ncbi:MAG: PilN domain-containing protein [Acidobacteriota bacterium]
MIRVNLLEGTAEQRVTIQKTRVAAKHGQQIFMLISALVIALLAIGIDHLWTTRAHADVKAEFDREQEQAKQLEADINRKNELENELKQLEERIKLIKQLRAEQKGPVAMLSAINERMPGGNADFKLTTITQKGNRLQIIGTSMNEQVVADFARQLEFSNGLFTNVIPVIEGTEVKIEEADKKEGDDKDTARVFKFTINCDYNKPRAEGEEKKAETK